MAIFNKKTDIDPKGAYKEITNKKNIGIKAKYKAFIQTWKNGNCTYFPWRMFVFRTILTSVTIQLIFLIVSKFMGTITGLIKGVLPLPKIIEAIILLPVNLAFVIAMTIVKSTVGLSSTIFFSLFFGFRGYLQLEKCD